MGNNETTRISVQPPSAAQLFRAAVAAESSGKPKEMVETLTRMAEDAARREYEQDQAEIAARRKKLMGDIRKVVLLVPMLLLYLLVVPIRYLRRLYRFVERTTRPD